MRIERMYYKGISEPSYHLVGLDLQSMVAPVLDDPKEHGIIPTAYKCFESTLNVLRGLEFKGDMFSLDSYNAELVKLVGGYGEKQFVGINTTTDMVFEYFVEHEGKAAHNSSVWYVRLFPKPCHD